MLSETYFNQNQLKSLTCYRKLIYEIHPHSLIMDTSVELPAKCHLHCAVINTHATTKVRDLFTC